MNLPIEMEILYDMALAENGKGILVRERSAIHGRGMFTRYDIPDRTILCRRLGLKTLLSARDKRAIIGIDGVDAACDEDANFKDINHSCQPNAYLTDTGCLLNLERIGAGTEITIDYNALLTGSNWQATCHCGSPDCRHIIKSNQIS